MNTPEKIIDRIRKLLALAKDKAASENEAATAMSMASDLMMKYNIDHVDDADAPGIIEGQYMRDQYKQKWHGFMHTAIATLYDCRGLETKSGFRKFVGRPFNVSACEETWEFVIEQVEALYKEGLKAFKGKMGRLSKDARCDFRDSFKQACALRILRKVKEIKAAQKNQIPDHKALVIIDTMKEELDTLFAAKGLKDRRPVKVTSGFGTGAGLAAGDQVNLNRRMNK
jgi:hypothetical protein